MDFNAFLASMTPDQLAALQAASAKPTVPSPKDAASKRKGKIGTAKPAPMPSDDEDEDETVPEAVSKVSVKIKDKGSTLPVVAPEQKRSTSGPVLRDSFGRSLPQSDVPVSVTFSYADGRQVSLPMVPKQFSSGSVGGHVSGKLPTTAADRRPLQVSLSAVYCKPKAE